MHGLVVIEGMTLSGHPWIINEIVIKEVDEYQIKESAMCFPYFIFSFFIASSIGILS